MPLSLLIIQGQLGVTQFNLPDALPFHLLLLWAMLGDGGRCLAAENEALDLCTLVLGPSSGFTCWVTSCHAVLSAGGPALSKERVGIFPLDLTRALVL